MICPRRPLSAALMVTPSFLAECFACCHITATMLLRGFMSAGTICSCVVLLAFNMVFCAVATTRMNIDVVRAFVGKSVQLQAPLLLCKATAASQIIVLLLAFCINLWNILSLPLQRGISLFRTMAEFAPSYQAAAMPMGQQDGAQSRHLKSSV